MKIGRVIGNIWATRKDEVAVEERIALTVYN